MSQSLTTFVRKHLRKTADGQPIVLGGIYFVEASKKLQIITPLPTITEERDVCIRVGEREIIDWVEFVNNEGRQMWVPVRAVYANRDKFLQSRTKTETKND